MPGVVDPPNSVAGGGRSCHGDRLLQSLVRKYAIADRVEFCGHVEDIGLVWSSNHLLITSSRSDGIPLGLVEAMVCGRPAVVTEVGGQLEWIDEPRTGFVAPAATETSLSAALERAWESRTSWKEMGKRAHDRAMKQVDPNPGQSLLSLLLEGMET